MRILTAKQAAHQINREAEEILPSIAEPCGDYWKCPVCGDSVSGIRFNPAKRGELHCGACGFRGSIIDLFMRSKSADYDTVLKMLSDLQGIEIEEGRKAAPVSLVTLDQVKETKPEWLIPGYIPAGAVTLISADGGIGKTAVWCNLIAAITTGNQSVFMEGRNPFESREALFFSGEDSISSVLVPRLRRAGADLARVHTVDVTVQENGGKIFLVSDDLRQIVKDLKPAVCVLDPLQAFLPAGVEMSARNDMRQALMPLIGLGEETGTAFIIICHTNKRSGVSGRNRVADSSDLWDIARSVLVCGQTDEDGIRYISQEKSNYGRLQRTVLFRVNDDGCAANCGFSSLKDADYQAAERTARSAPVVDDTKLRIVEILRDGQKEAAALDEELRAAGASDHSIRRAKEALKKEGRIRVFSRGFSPRKFYAELTTREPEGTDPVFD